MFLTLLENEIFSAFVFDFVIIFFFSILFLLGTFNCCSLGEISFFVEVFLTSLFSILFGIIFTIGFFISIFGIFKSIFGICFTNGILISSPFISFANKISFILTASIVCTYNSLLIGIIAFLVSDNCLIGDFLIPFIFLL